MSLTLICRWRRRFNETLISGSTSLPSPRTTAFTHGQVVIDEAEDDVGADENAGAADPGAAVHRDGT